MAGPSGQRTSAPPSIDPDILRSRRFGEAPMLSEKVRRGELPPVSERLPENPLVVVPVEEIGRYGGVIRKSLTGDIVQIPGVSKTLGENLMGYQRPLPKSILHSLAESYAFQDSGKTALFRIRKGTKWSDGAPFTVDDVLFWYEDMTLNPDARTDPQFPSVWLVEGKPIQMAKVDDLTLRVSSHKPLGRILHILCTDYIAFPKHALAKFHPRYNPAATYEGLRDSTTRALLLYKPGAPLLAAWVPIEWERGQRIVFARNPYYWKVDSAGNQLPYADSLVFNIVRDPQVDLLKFINGETDLFGRYAEHAMFPTLKVAERMGKIRVRLGLPAPESTFRLNWDAPRPEVRRAIRDKRVRIALSVAVNREEIAQILYYGLLEPGGHTFGPASQFYSVEATRRHAEYDPEQARRLLDGAGYRDADGDGTREFLDGTPFSLTIDVVPGMGVDVSQLVADYWREVGIGVHLNVALRDILFPKWSSGTFEVFWWGGWSDDPVVNRNDWAITGPNQPVWHRNAGTEGPDWLLEASRLVEEAGTTVDTVLIRRNFEQVRDLYAENLAMVLLGYAHNVWGSSTRLGNVPEENTMADGYRGFDRPVYHEQIYIREK